MQFTKAYLQSVVGNSLSIFVLTSLFVESNHREQYIEEGGSAGRQYDSKYD